MTTTLRLDDAAGLDAAAVLAIARGEVMPELSGKLVRRLEARRGELLGALAAGEPVYGVTTGMGALSERSLSAAAQSRHQEALMTARAVGGPPWLSPAETRAVLAVRLRTFLNGDAAVGSALCRRLAESIAYGVLPAMPRRSTGVAGEIVGLAHLGAALTGTGDVLSGPGPGPGSSPGPGSGIAPAGPALAAAGLRPLRLGPKEGVALIEGVPMTTALALLAGADARAILRHAVSIVAAEFAVTGAARDVLDARLVRGDSILAATTALLRDLAGTVTRPRALQPPVSFRASAQVLAHLARMVDALDSAVERALNAVTDSPAFLDREFVGTAGFYGYDLATHLHALTVALIGVAELGTTRLHRLMDPAISGLPAQLSAEPGPQTGISPVHKRAVGAAHELRRQATPSIIGPVETSGGQEDAQAFSLEAAQSCRIALYGVIEVLACELLAVHQARCLGAILLEDAAQLGAALDMLTAGLPASPADRPFGRDIETLRDRLRTSQSAAVSAGIGPGDGPARLRVLVWLKQLLVSASRKKWCPCRSGLGCGRSGELHRLLVHRYGQPPARDARRPGHLGVLLLRMLRRACCRHHDHPGAA
jgi:histidine ammonia-lyase